jgi:hypothetical protein
VVLGLGHVSFVFGQVRCVGLSQGDHLLGAFDN